MEADDIPIYRGLGMSDVREVPKKPWKRIGGMVVNNPGGTGWSHLHHSTGAEPLRLMVYGGATQGVGPQINRPGETEVSGNLPLEEGRRSITSRNEDPHIREEYRPMLAAEGVQFQMPDWAYEGTVPEGEMLKISGP